MKNIIEAIDAKLQSLKDEIYYKDLRIEALKKDLQAEVLKRELEQANPAENNSPSGYWVKEVDEHEICATEFTCSCCGKSFSTSELTDEMFIESMKYCPNCGAKMR